MYVVRAKAKSGTVLYWYVITIERAEKLIERLYANQYAYILLMSRDEKGGLQPIRSRFIRDRRSIINNAYKELDADKFIL